MKKLWNFIETFYKIMAIIIPIHTSKIYRE